MCTAVGHIFLGNPCQNDSEFIATDAVDIFTAKAVAEDFCGITDVLVSCKMAFGIIHSLQTVEVAHNDSNRLGSIKMIVVRPGQGGAVFAAGKRVVNGAFFQFLGIVAQADHHGNDKLHHIDQDGNIIHIFGRGIVHTVKTDIFPIDLDRPGNECLNSLRF